MFKQPPDPKSILLTIMLMVIATPIFIESFGPNLLCTGNGSFRMHSKFIYLGASVLGQLGYSIGTSIRTGILVFPAFEGGMLSSMIHSRSMALSETAGFSVTMACLAISAVATAIMAVLLAVFKRGHLIKAIPENIMFAMMLGSGVGMLLFGCYPYFQNEDKVAAATFTFMSLTITFVLICILKRTGDPLHAIFYILGICLVMNIARLCGASEFFYETHLFQTKSFIEPLSFGRFLGDLDTSAITVGSVLSSAHLICSLSIYTLITFATSLPAYTATVRTEFSPNRELVAYAFSNLYSSISFFPTSLNGNGSVMFNSFQCNTRLHSLLACVVMGTVFLYHHHLAGLIPTFATSLLSQFVGISMLVSQIPLLRSLSAVDLLNVFVRLVIYILSQGNVLIVLAAGFAINAIVTRMFSSYFVSSKQMVTVMELENNEVSIMVKGVLDYRNISAVLAAAPPCYTGVVLNLRDCGYMDLTANMELDKCMEGRKFTILGHPTNMYRQEVEEPRPIGPLAELAEQEQA